MAESVLPSGVLVRLRRWVWRPRSYRCRVAGVSWGEEVFDSGPFHRRWHVSLWLLPREDLTDDFELVLSALVLSLKVRRPRNLCGAAHVAPRPLLGWDGRGRIICADQPEPRYLIRLACYSDAREILDRNARACGQWHDTGAPDFLGETASRNRLWRSTREPGCDEHLGVVDRGFPRRMRAGRRKSA